MPSRRLVLLPVIASLMLAACGGEDAPSADEFARQAEQICNDVEKAGNALKEPESPAEVPAFADQAKKTVDDGVKRLQELEVPEGEAGEKAEAFVSSITEESEQRVKPALDELSEAARSGDVNKLQEAAERIQKTDTGRSDELAREIGANACADS